MLDSAIRHLAQSLGGDARWNYDGGRARVIVSYPLRDRRQFNEVVIIAVAKEPRAARGATVDKVACQVLLTFSGQGEHRGVVDGVQFERACSCVVKRGEG